MLLLLVSLVVMFSGLGIWQLQRLAWKRELIATVDARIHAEPVPVPDSADWAGMTVEDLVYQRVCLSGTFDHTAEVQSLAVSELGSGYWVMTPLQLYGGGTVLVNRGFVPQSMRDPTKRLASTPTGNVVVTGLLRASEPKGGFLRDNDPDAGRWYSRDTAAIAQAKRLTDPVAPFFVDAGSGDDAAITADANAVTHGDVVGSISGFPRGGLTVVTFRNTHLVYALTWFALAILGIFGIMLLSREWRKGSPSTLSDKD